MTPADLEAILPKAGPLRVAADYSHIQEAMEEFEVNTPLRQAAFLAEIGEETNDLHWFTEIWGPTPAQLRYDKHPKLGNREPGDGFKYRGRGALQLTGRANYVQYGQELGVDLVNHPDRASDPDVAYRIAGRYWQDDDLNCLADEGKFDKITLAINGGFNGKAGRDERYARAKAVLGC